MNSRMAAYEDIDMLIKLRFDYFTAEKWDLTDDKRDLISSQLRQYYPKHLNHDFFAALVERLFQQHFWSFLRNRQIYHG